MKPAARDRQVGGDHYQNEKNIQPWDFIEAIMSPEAFQGFLTGNIIKYAGRWKKKNGRQDLLKLKHYVEKLLEVVPE